MTKRTLFPTSLYIRKFFNTFFPRILFSLSPNRFWARHHWSSQNEGDQHGFDNYCMDRPAVGILLGEMQQLVPKDTPILDLGCNCGYYLSRLKGEGYTHLTGVDICENAITYGREHLELSGVETIPGSFEDILPQLSAENRKFGLVYTVGATIELVHPSFDVIGHICALSQDYIVIFIGQWGHAYPRFWDYEFNRNGFLQVKNITPYDGNADSSLDPTQISSLMIYKRWTPKQTR
jgi:SAM-dependent methyltransferase